ncbi:hypothetical protein DFA_08569 [Cavenderia fasciculata]|uniref:ORC1/DEAH AAA+ ATPase domain-containing protein n=1 Tax=Cavenderia fasciculata TaxID=261658 RepID=F4Q309_CACFS|nr:uncharacterized protein DFA_08569 [Cavenderia fasciculata]EGG17573.1 hypothetical protein DFA_08569 [Cavenderia fasciculata]|eukprot:XP_004356057.1 hypothetical protein DFA_08569 [Cavenderia fasciculata]
MSDSPLKAWVLSKECEIDIDDKQGIVEQLDTNRYRTVEDTNDMTDSDWERITKVGKYIKILRTYTRKALNNQPQQNTLGKTWTFGLPISDQVHYHVPFSSLQLNQILNGAMNGGGCYLVQGAYRSGKTSHLKAVSTELVVEMNHSTITNIWSWLSVQINITNPQSPNITSAEEFSKHFFRHANQHDDPQKNVVLLIDEFQMILECDPIQTQEFLGQLGDIHNYHQKFLSVVGFGTPQLMALASDKKFWFEFKSIDSPFTYDNIILITPLPKQEVSLLLQRWASDHSLKIDDDVLEDIYNTIGGYAGLLGICGIVLDDNTPLIVSKHNRHINFGVWLSLRVSIISRFMDQEQYRRLESRIASNPNLSLIIPQIVGTQEPYTF